MTVATTYTRSKEKVILSGIPPRATQEQGQILLAANGDQGAIDAMIGPGAGNSSNEAGGGRNIRGRQFAAKRLAALLTGAQDGHLTLNEANAWYEHGGGEPITVDLERIDLSGITVADFGDNITKAFNLLDPVNMGTLNDALVYGTITLTLGSDRTVTAAFPDTYNFDMKPATSFGTAARNSATTIGRAYAGSGISFQINFRGHGTLGQ